MVDSPCSREFCHKPSASLAIDVQQLASLHRFAGVVGLAIRWEGATAHVFAIFAHRAGNDFAEVGIFPGKFWRGAKREPQEIVDHQNLAVALGTGSDTDREN